MPRAAAHSDVFNAVAESRRRDILSYLAPGERSVSQIVEALELEQPSVSKHLRVLHGVGLVRSRRDGRRILYRTNPIALKPLYDWTETLAQHWKRQSTKIKKRAERRPARPNRDDLNDRRKER